MATQTRVSMPHTEVDLPSEYSLNALSICHMFGPSRAAQLDRTCVTIARSELQPAVMRLTPPVEHQHFRAP